MSAATRTVSSAAAVRRWWRLPVPLRKAVLVLHLASAAGWLGMDVVLGILVLNAALSRARESAAVSYQAIEIFAVWALLPAGLTCLATGLVLGLSSRYGVLRYRWVAVKLLINIVLTGLVPVALRPAAASAAEYGRQLAAGHLSAVQPTAIFYPPIVSPIALIIALVLAVYKPWGPLRWRWTRTRAAPPPRDQARPPAIPQNDQATPRRLGGRSGQGFAEQVKHGPPRAFGGEPRAGAGEFEHHGASARYSLSPVATITPHPSARRSGRAQDRVPWPAVRGARTDLSPDPI
jgi:hypothetical protein